jgi:hypothetical protein
MISRPSISRAGTSRYRSKKVDAAASVLFWPPEFRDASREQTTIACHPVGESLRDSQSKRFAVQANSSTHRLSGGEVKTSDSISRHALASGPKSKFSTAKNHWATTTNAKGRGLQRFNFKYSELKKESPAVAFSRRAGKAVAPVDSRLHRFRNLIGLLESTRRQPRSAALQSRPLMIEVMRRSHCLAEAVSLVCWGCSSIG